MSAEPSRNDPCPCGSGLKYKHCCEGKTKWTDNSLIMGAGVAILVVLGIILASMAFSNLGDQGGAPDCPPGQVWSAAHGHCH
ncbi:MAG: SEC-C metal-binding domain-containing protein [Rhodothermales bacterium]